MNPRIELVNDAECRVVALTDPGSRNIVPIKAGISGMRIDDCYFTRVALEALRDCINAYLNTGSFAALADTSPVPYTGKRMRHSEENGEVQILDCTSRAYCYLKNDSLQFGPHPRSMSGLLPLTPPAPKVRPFTPAEALPHLGRELRTRSGRADWLRGIRASGITTHCGKALSYESFAEHMTWADDNSPCGIQEATP